jgi:pimeloyl-ACP methyl ester carboxylesterase/predicted glycosyltransferase
MRAVEPQRSGLTNLCGFQVAWESFGDIANPTILFFPSWQFVHSRIWKFQVPFLSRDFHVLTFDPPGNGKSERTLDDRAFGTDPLVDFGVGLLDEFDIDKAHVVGLSRGALYGLWMAARYPERVLSGVFIGSSLWRVPGLSTETFWEVRSSYEGWEKFNAHHWRANFEDWIDFFMSRVASEPHSTKQFDDLRSWARQTTPEILIKTVINPLLPPQLSLDDVLERIECPVLLIHGTEDQIVPVDVSRELAERRADFEYLEMEDSGHAPNARDPVIVNDAIASFLGRSKPARRTWQRSMARNPKRALFVSSPIGLGHIPRDLAIANELRALVPDLQIDWLATHPISVMLEDAGESIHPLSSQLSNKSTHWESMAGEFELHCFYAFREMDEVLVHNFMVFLDAVRERPYDIWIGDEAWEIDHYLHENPELKTAPFVFMTDFVGYLPIDRSPGSREAFLTADYNAEIIAHIERYPWIRDKSLYFGEFDDVVPDCFGPGLPRIRDWMEEHFIPVGHVMTFDPEDYQDRAAVRVRLGYDPDATIVVAAAGGTAAGRLLLERVADSWPMVRDHLPEAECMVVAGPRMDVSGFPEVDGVSVLGYVDRLYEHFASADLGIVQGGLTTTMELTALRVPFLYFPLRNHFEQQFHVAHRLNRYTAGQRMDFHSMCSQELAGVITRNIGASTGHYGRVSTNGAFRAAEQIATILS